MYTSVVVVGIVVGLAWWAADRTKNGILNALAWLTADDTVSDDPLSAGDPTPEQLDTLQQQSEVADLTH
jgi:hypothetical protein